MSRLYTRTLVRPPTRRRYTIYQNGQRINRHQLFSYRNGRFLINEGYELAKRYAPFNVDALCEIIAALPQVSSPVASIDKKEGGYNKGLLVTAENGRQVVAKIPCLNIVPPWYGTASEVAVLQMVREQTSIPVSKVLTWSDTKSNPVGSEYIVLEKSHGTQLTALWDDLKEQDRVQLIRAFARLESQLTGIKFPAYGSLFMRDRLAPPLHEPGRTIDVDERYCLGPMYHGSWPGGYAANPEEYAQYAGPSFAQQGIWQIEHFKTSYGGRGPHFGTPAEHVEVLRMAVQVMPLLATLPAIEHHSTPVLCHPDFHPGNIFVAAEDPTRITGVIDWQFTAILPRFTQVQWPLFLNPPEEYQTGMGRPELPPHFDDQDVEKDEEYSSTGAALLKSHLESYLALTETDVAIRQLFTSCPYTYRDGIVPLRDCLVRLYQEWPRLNVPGDRPCPYSFSRVEIDRHERQMADYRDWLNLRKYTFELLQSNEGGWVPPQVDFAAAQSKMQLLYRRFVRSKAKEMPEREARKLWFFRERG
ncbi:hypothetical protein ASPZODRAFT_676262 [Penicilliopsis zonata CBS 506.65]|uniref:Altered inheritance of mitochondria protein 9, mitochondrial n=1 Tax=Penicilliopsis zonata CBS 506.65 TaxID=1073090 RepID=A0A1L9SD45_9EURO|nr:hypothetical protein ASPZODRAFT_676262 [Penicilliopsis zonata CBS 506.65]OJJ45089.1 hypothetical protein ASPZODRAFT_676262 [Penicilliopsis zonata CBS 506.65]